MLFITFTHFAEKTMPPFTTPSPLATPTSQTPLHKPPFTTPPAQTPFTTLLHNRRSQTPFKTPLHKPTFTNLPAQTPLHNPPSQLPFTTPPPPSQPISQPPFNNSPPTNTLQQPPRQPPQQAPSSALLFPCPSLTDLVGAWARATCHFSFLSSYDASNMTTSSVLSVFVFVSLCSLLSFFVCLCLSCPLSLPFVHLFPPFLFALVPHVLLTTVLPLSQRFCAHQLVV